MAIDRELLSIIGDIYDCAIDPGLWPQTLERILDRTHCDCAGINMVDPLENRVSLIINHRASDEFSAAMINAAAFNPVMTAGWFVDVDEPFTTGSYLGETEYLASRFYKEIVSAHGYREAILLVLAKTGRRYGVIALPRTIAQGVPSETDLEDMRLLAPHIRRAVTIADLIDSQLLTRDMLSETLDLMTTGVILVDKACRLVHTNAAAARQLDAGRALRREGEFLSAQNANVSKQIRDAIIRAAEGGPATIGATGIALSVPASDGTDLGLWFLPLDGGLRRDLGAPYSAKVAIFLRDPADNSAFPGELFVHRYNITPAECRFMMMLTQGMSTKEAAYAVGIAESTAKTHLQHLFAKTGVQRQADLIRLALTALSPARLPMR
ncbi:MAG: LuxR C-terminal-related transcriptional regulator [Bradyrhizobium sp.]